MNKIVVITGGTSGIGLELKKLYEAQGDTVLTFSIDEVDSANHYVGSVTHEIKVRQVFNDIHEKYGKIDVLVNCAGIGESGITELMPLEDINKVVDVNYYGTLYCTRSALPHMGEGARIVNMSSAMALFPVPFRSIYASAKSAVLSLSFALRMELAPLGIDVVAICPGDTKTNFTANRIKDMTTSERYGDRLAVATERSDAGEDSRMSAVEVSAEIFKFITGAKTKPFYIIGKKYKRWYFLSKFVSTETILKKIAKLKDAKVKSVKVEKPKKEKKVNLKKLMKEQEKALAEATIDGEMMGNMPTDNLDTTAGVESANVESVATEEPVVETAPVEESPTESTSVTEESTPVAEESETKSEPMTEEKRASILSGIMSRINVVNKPDDGNEN